MICSRSPFCLVAKDGPWAGILIRVQEMGLGGRVGIRGDETLGLDSGFNTFWEGSFQCQPESTISFHWKLEVPSREERWGRGP